MLEWILKNKSWIFDGIGVVVLGAIFTAVFKRRHSSRPSPRQKINHGSGIQVGGNVGGNVFISSAPPSEAPSRILEVAQQISQIANESLVENERILSAVIRDPEVERYLAGEQLGHLFENQRHRNLFGEWIGFLKYAAPRESDSEIRQALEDLLTCVERLHEAFYSFDNAVKRTNIWKTKKYFVELVLAKRSTDPNWVSLSGEEVAQIARNYLEFLRGTVQQVGNATGTLKAKLR